MAGPKYDYWLGQELWTLRRACTLLLEEEPPSRLHRSESNEPVYTEYYDLSPEAQIVEHEAEQDREEYDENGRLVHPGTLYVIRYRETIAVGLDENKYLMWLEVDAKHFIEWAHRRGYTIPEPLRCMLPEEQARTEQNLVARDSTTDGDTDQANERRAAGSVTCLEPDDANAPANQLIFDSGEWRGAFEGQTFENLRALDGVTYIAYLLDHPEKGVTATELYWLAHPPPPQEQSEQSHLEGQLGQPAAARHGYLDVNADITPEAQRKIEQKLRELKKDEQSAEDALVIARETGNTSAETEAAERIEQIHDEWKRIRKLLGQVTRPTSQGGRVARTTGPEEKNRKAVWGAIKRAKKAIGEICPDLAQHLSAIKTASTCTYNPDSTKVSWDIRLP